MAVESPPPPRVCSLCVAQTHRASQARVQWIEHPNTDMQIASPLSAEMGLTNQFTNLNFFARATIKGRCLIYPTCKATDLPSEICTRLLKMSAEDAKVYVGNLPQDIKVRDLEDVFYKYGKILDVDLHNGRGVPYAFVEFEDPR